MNKLGYQVNWTDTRKYITYTTPEGYKCRDNKLYDKKYSKGVLENEFRRIKEEQSNSKGKSSNSINSKNELLSSRTRDNEGFISNGTSNSRRYDNYEKESSRYTRRFIKDNIRMNEEMKKLVEEKVKDQFYNLKRELKATEEEQKRKIFKIKWKIGLVTFLVGLLLSAIWFLPHK